MFITGYYLNTVVLYFVLVSVCEACKHGGTTEAFLDISFKDISGGEDHILNQPGTYGCESPHRQTEGYLFHIPNQNWCIMSSLKASESKPVGKSWIALIPRGNCTSVEKILNAKRFNASAVLIYDTTDGKEGFKGFRHEGAGGIVAVMITNSLGKKVKERYHDKDTSTVFVRIKPGITHYRSRRGWQVSKQSVLFVLVSFILLMCISLAWLVFYYVQRFRYFYARDRKEVSILTQ